MSKIWIVDDEMSDRYPLYTRGNVGEVFPDPVAPFTWTLVGFGGSELGWRDAFERFGAFDHDEFSPSRNEILACFGGYCYLNVSVSRIFGVRVPGLTPELVDFSLFGEQAGAPPYEARPGDESEAHSERINATLGWILTVEDLPELREHQDAIEELRSQRPDVSTLSDRELLERTRQIMGRWWRPLFAQHLFNTYCAMVGAGIMTTVATELGDPTMAMRLVAGIGDVDSAAPSWAMWDLSRLVVASPALTSQFERGVDGLLERLRADGGGDASGFLEAFDRFLYQFGSRGPNEWELRSPTWETDPRLALTAIDRMRVSPETSNPQLSKDQRASDREALSAHLVEQLSGAPEVQGQFQAGLRAASLFLAARERSKTTIVRMINEARVHMHELGRRMVAAGHFDEVRNFGVFLDEELDQVLEDPSSFRDVIRERESRLAELAELEPPFILNGSIPSTSSWRRRNELDVAQAEAGHVLQGIPGCPGQAEGRARVIQNPFQGGQLQPGEVLVAPITDPSWTPLFVTASAVVVDVGAQISHAVIVSRELGIPCVVSLEHGTRRIRDGALVRVDGTTGAVTVLE